MIYDLFALGNLGVEYGETLPDRGIRRRGFASGVEVPVEDLDAYVKRAAQAHDPVAQVNSEQLFSDFGISLAASTGFRKWATGNNADGSASNTEYIYTTAAGAVRNVEIYGNGAGFTGSSFGAAVDRIQRFHGYHVFTSGGNFYHSTDSGSTHSSAWTKPNAGWTPVDVYIHTDGTTIVKWSGTPTHVLKYSSVANAASNTSSTTLSHLSSSYGLNKLLYSAGDLYITSSNSHATFFKYDGFAVPVFGSIGALATGNFVGGFLYRGRIWWKETDGLKRVFNHREYEVARQPFAFTTHQFFGVCGSYLIDLSDNYLRYSQDGATWCLHSYQKASQDIQATDRRLFYSEDNVGYIPRFTGLL